jgi:hypothetical protein
MINTGWKACNADKTNGTTPRKIMSKKVYIYIYIEKDMSYPSHKPWNTTNIHRSCKSKFHHGTAKFLSSSHR